MQRERHTWNEDEEELFEQMDFWKKKEEKKSGFNYIYKEKENKGNQA